MRTFDTIDPGEFVAAVEPLLEGQDLHGLDGLLRSRWTCEQILSLLRSEHTDARKVALLAMGLVGGSHCLPALVDQLKDGDPMVTELAEHALWSIWFRNGTPEANKRLCRGAMALDRRDFEGARRHFSEAVELDGEFAEAYNQRALAEYLNEEYEDCIRDCREAVRRMPCHFGAWAGMGHAHLHLGEKEEALACYERALEIHPRLGCIREAVCALKGGRGGGETMTTFE